LPANVRLGWKGMTVANTLAFHNKLPESCFNPVRIDQISDTLTGGKFINVQLTLLASF
jgi:hypothetical protein